MNPFSHTRAQLFVGVVDGMFGWRPASGVSGNLRERKSIDNLGIRDFSDICVENTRNCTFQQISVRAIEELDRKLLNLSAIHRKIEGR